MNSQKVDQLNPVISDSFLRSYSISRIVRINEENRNKAKVTIMRKKNRKKSNYSPNWSNFGNDQQDLTNIKSLKQELTRIDSSKDGQRRIKRKTKVICESNSQKQSFNKLLPLERSRTLKDKNSSFHRRYNSDALEPSSKMTQTMSINIRSKISNQAQIKAQLRMNTIKFSNHSRRTHLKTNIRMDEEQECSQNVNSLSATLSSFNRLRLLTNAKSSQNIMKHFYKRSLQNCSLEDLKFLLETQKHKKESDQIGENSNCMPMKFGKTQLLRRTYCDSTVNQFDVKSEKQQKKAVWKNQVLRQNCPLNENTQIINNSKSASSPKKEKEMRQKKVKSNIYSSKIYSNQNSVKENLREQPSFTQVNSKQAQIEKNLVYCYRDKRFPIGENKLNGIFQKWNQQHLKKKKIQQFKFRSSYNETHQNRELRAKSIKLKDKSIEQQIENNPNDNQTSPSETSLKQTYHQQNQLSLPTDKQSSNQSMQ